MSASSYDIQQMLEEHFTGELDQTILYVRLCVFAIGVLFTGLVLWRITVIFLQKKLKQRRRTSRFERKWR
jgi:Ni,Fe-hydrogenase I cytochrome b subunit